MARCASPLVDNGVQMRESRFESLNCLSLVNFCNLAYRFDSSTKMRRVIGLAIVGGKMNKQNLRNVLAVTTSAAISFSMGIPAAVAQESAATSGALEEVIVTARKRE